MVWEKGLRYRTHREIGRSSLRAADGRIVLRIVALRVIVLRVVAWGVVVLRVVVLSAKWLRSILNFRTWIRLGSLWASLKPAITTCAVTIALLISRRRRAADGLRIQRSKR
jgi:hypothetical protein